MPEHNFEQQARDMANGFNVEPKPEVWQNVRNAIQQPRRKRRLVLWWLLLPLALISGGIAFFMLTDTGKESLTVKTDSTHHKTPGKKQIPAIQEKEQQVGGKQELEKSDTDTTIILSNNSVANHKQSKDKKTENRTADVEESNKAQKEKIAIIKRRNEQSVVYKKEQHPNNNQTLNKQSFSIIKDTNATSNEKTIPVQSYPALRPKIEVDIVRLSKDSTALAKLDKAVSTILPVSTSSNIINPDSSKTSKPKKNKAIHWGIIAEGGIAARKSSILSLAESGKRLDDPQSFPNVNGSWSMLQGLPNSNGFYYNSSVKQGSAFGFGIALQKKWSRSIDLFTDVSYQHQSHTIATTVYKDSLVLNNAFAALAGSYQATQNFHFASLFAGINWHFINTKRLQLGISAGADNLVLLAAKQNINDVNGNSSNFSYAAASRISTSASETSNFYRYQPSLFAGILLNIKTGNRQLQLVPFARSSFRPFDKQTVSSNNHLFSAGLKAAYFFK